MNFRNRTRRSKNDEDVATIIRRKKLINEIKKISTISLILTTIFVGIFAIKVNISNADNNQYLATDKNIFGDNALIANSEADQSEKLQESIKKASLDKKELFIPAGKYYINKSIALRTSNINIIGDRDGATILANKDNAPDVIFDADNYIRTMQNLRFENLYLDGIQIKMREKTNIRIENNVFYHSNADHIISVLVGKNIDINHNIFLRDLDHALLHDRNSRTIYVGGYDWGDQYKFIENVNIIDNIFGAKIDELDAIKTLQQAENQRNIAKLQKLLKEKRLV